jgi:type II secretory pathway component PulJ
MKRPGRRPWGFTLLEIVLAVGLVVLLTGAVYAFYQLTLGVRDDVRRRGQVAVAQRRAMALMAAELESAMVYPFFMMGLRGDSEQVDFMRTAVPSRAVFFSDELLSFSDTWDSNSARAAPSWEPEHDVQMVTYRLSRYEDEDGVEQIGGLECARLRSIAVQTSEERADESGSGRRTLGTGLREEEPEEDTSGVATIRVSLLTEHVKFLNLRYWDGAAWVESWSQRDLPGAVMIEMGAEPLPEDLLAEEYPFEKITRVVAIPAGYRPPEGGMIAIPGPSREPEVRGQRGGR